MKLRPAFSRVSVLLLLGMAAVALSGSMESTRLKAKQSDDNSPQTQVQLPEVGKAEKETPPKTPETDGSGKKEITYSKDVAPILFQHCVACHHPNDIAPMSLLTYKETRPWAMSIREKVVQRVMPPWHADPTIGEFTNDPRLSEIEITIIRD